MLFNTPEYFVFLAIILFIYYALTHRWQNYMLLVASYIFYGFWDWRYLSLIWISTIIDYGMSLLIADSTSTARRRAFLIVSIVANLGFLGFFKYCNFFVDNAARMLSYVGLEPNLPVLYIVLPVGISFYTFQTMSYTIDVYRGKMKPTRNLLDFALYVCYFPQLVAGPIERAQNLLPALQAKRTVSTDMFISGCVLILVGLFRKVVIADGLGAQIDGLFASPGSYSSPELMMGIYLFALQIYCDFAGYSDIARGTSRLLGIELMENFNQPYFSTNISEFWRRWHISLSSWLRDYLYIPLGGNRNGTFNTFRNLMLTMLLGGLWHGAAWSFVVWGGLHGLYLIGYRLLSGPERPMPDGQKRWGWQQLVGLIVTFHLVLLAWVFFRSAGFGAAINYLTNLLTFRNMGTLLDVLPAILVPWLLLLAIDVPQYISRNHTILLQWPKTMRNVAVAGMLLLVLLGIGTRAPFIYFQF